MNSIICLLSAFHILRLIEAKYSLQPGARLLVSLGALTPVGDYILRFAMGERWFQTRGFMFHSFAYQTLFWFVVGLLYWVHCRNIKSASRFLYPLGAMLMYAVFTALSTESAFFLKPLSSEVIRLDWMISGYLVPSAIIIVFWILFKLFKVSSLNSSKLILGFLFLFIVSGGIIRFNITNALKRSFPDIKKFEILPVDIIQSNWRVISRDENKYLVLKYNLIEGWQGTMTEKPVVNDPQLYQNILMDPLILHLYERAFKNPVLNLRLQSEFINIEISELESSTQLFLIEKANIIKNRSGQILDFSVEYRSVF